MGDDGDGRAGAADRLRQCGEPDDCAGGVAAEGDRGAAGARCGTGAHRPPAFGGGAAAGIGRRPGGADHFALGHTAADRHHAGDRPASSVLHGSKPAPGVLHDGDLGGDGRDFRALAGAAGGAAGYRAGTERSGGSGGGRRAGALAQDAGGGAGESFAAAADWSRTFRAQPAQSEKPQPRIRGEQPAQFSGGPHLEWLQSGARQALLPATDGLAGSASQHQFRRNVRGPAAHFRRMGQLDRRGRLRRQTGRGHESASESHLTRVFRHAEDSALPRQGFYGTGRAGCSEGGHRQRKVRPALLRRARRTGAAYRYGRRPRYQDRYRDRRRGARHQVQPHERGDAAPGLLPVPATRMGRTDDRLRPHADGPRADVPDDPRGGAQTG